MSFNLLIFKKIKEGDIPAFESLFRTYYEPLCRYACQWVEDVETAEEIVQDLFYVLWKERQNLQIFTSVNGYLYRSVKNKSLQYLERQRVREAYRKTYAENAVTETVSPQEELEYKELEQHLQETLYHLPERRQKIFCMNRMEGKKYSEIAQELHISVKTVEAEISKTLRELRTKYNINNCKL
jgi:RNA polymerase sigma-70 factor (ECF subfamily)